MPTFSNSPTPCEDPTSMEQVTPPAEPVHEDAPQEEPVNEIPAQEAPVSEDSTQEAPVSEDSAQENPASDDSTQEAPVSEASNQEAAAGEEQPQQPPEPPKPEAPPPMPWAIVVRHFAQAPADAYKKLNGDFHLSLDAHSFSRLQKLFRTVLNREPTAGELCILDTLDRQGRGQPHREAVGELYTDSSAIAETWADMMAKHGQLFAASGLLRKERRTPPPCTFGEALTLMGRYLHRAGLVSPLSDGLPFGGKNSDGRTAVLCSPAQEADAIAEGYIPVQKLNFGNTTRSAWVRHGSAMAVTPEHAGDFLVCLPSPDPAALASVLQSERKKSHPAIGAIMALADRSPLEAVLALCSGAELYPTRLPHRPAETDGPVDLLRLCQSPVLTPECSPDYLLRVPAKKVRELGEALRAAGMVAISVGQVRSGRMIRVHLRQGDKDIPVADLATDTLRAYPTLALYRRRAEITPFADVTVAPAEVLPLPELGLLTSSSCVTVTEDGVGYAAAMKAVAAAVAPLNEEMISTRDIRLSVALIAADGEDAHGSMTLEVLCGLYRAAAEGGMAIEDPVFTVEAPAEGQVPAVRLSVVAYRLA